MTVAFVSIFTLRLVYFYFTLFFDVYDRRSTEHGAKVSVQTLYTLLAPLSDSVCKTTQNVQICYTSYSQADTSRFSPSYYQSTLLQFLLSYVPNRKKPKSIQLQAFYPFTLFAVELKTLIDRKKSRELQSRTFVFIAGSVN